MASSMVVFDLETQKGFDEVGGRENLHLLKVSVGCIYDFASSTYICYTEAEVNKLIDALFSSNCVIGFNLLQFDFKVLEPYLEPSSKRKFSNISTIDMLEETRKELGFRVSLNSFASSTLSGKDGKVEKIANGLQALEWWKSGEIEKIKEYCKHDVELTRRLYEYGRNNGYLYYWDKKRDAKLPVRASWYSAGFKLKSNA